MKFYNKYFASNYEELITYYPRFYREVFEMVEILKAHGRIADAMETAIEQTYFNCFIDLADENTITKLEEFLSLGGNGNRTLEERRSIVKSYFVGFGKISATKLKGMLFPFTETESEITFLPADEERNNLLSITIPRGNTQYLSALEIMDMLARRLPAHIWYGVNLIYQDWHRLFFGIATSFIKEMSFTSENEDVSAVAYLTDETGGVLVDESGTILIE